MLFWTITWSLFFDLNWLDSIYSLRHENRLLFFLFAFLFSINDGFVFKFEVGLIFFTF